MTVQSINNLFYYLLFISILFSKPDDIISLLIGFIAINTLFLISSLNSKQSLWELQLDNSKVLILESLLFLTLAYIFSFKLFFYLFLFRLAQSIITFLFFEIYSRII